MSKKQAKKMQMQEARIHPTPSLRVAFITHKKTHNKVDKLN